MRMLLLASVKFRICEPLLATLMPVQVVEPPDEVCVVEAGNAVGEGVGDAELHGAAINRALAAIRIARSLRSAFWRSGSV